MKTWVMVRHAKSSWEFNLPDRERPLADRGVKDAILVSQELNKHNLHINQVYSSPAKRAFDTALIMVSELGLSTENIQIEEPILGSDLSLQDKGFFSKFYSELTENLKANTKIHLVTYFGNVEGNIDLISSTLVLVSVPCS